MAKTTTKKAPAKLPALINKTRPTKKPMAAKAAPKASKKLMALKTPPKKSGKTAAR